MVHADLGLIVVVVVQGMTQGLTRREEVLKQVIVGRLSPYLNWSLTTAKVVAAVTECLCPFEIGQHIPIAPACQSFCLPFVKILAISAYPIHSIYS
jgi:hypothetical protein